MAALQRTLRRELSRDTTLFEFLDDLEKLLKMVPHYSAFTIHRSMKWLMAANHRRSLQQGKGSRGAPSLELRTQCLWDLFLLWSPGSEFPFEEQSPHAAGGGGPTKPVLPLRHSLTCSLFPDLVVWLASGQQVAALQVLIDHWIKPRWTIQERSGDLSRGAPRDHAVLMQKLLWALVAGATCRRMLLAATPRSAEEDDEGLSSHSSVLSQKKRLTGATKEEWNETCLLNYRTVASVCSLSAVPSNHHGNHAGQEGMMMTMMMDVALRIFRFDASLRRHVYHLTVLSLAHTTPQLIDGYPWIELFKELLPPSLVQNDSVVAELVSLFLLDRCSFPDQPSLLMRPMEDRMQRDNRDRVVQSLRSLQWTTAMMAACETCAEPTTMMNADCNSSRSNGSGSGSGGRSKLVVPLPMLLASSSSTPFPHLLESSSALLGLSPAQQILETVRMVGHQYLATVLFAESFSSSSAAEHHKQEEVHTVVTALEDDEYGEGATTAMIMTKPSVVPPHAGIVVAMFTALAAAGVVGELLPVVQDECLEFCHGQLASLLIKLSFQCALMVPTDPSLVRSHCRAEEGGEGGTTADGSTTSPLLVVLPSQAFEWLQWLAPQWHLLPIARRRDTVLRAVFQLHSVECYLAYHNYYEALLCCSSTLFPAPSSSETLEEEQNPVATDDSEREGSREIFRQSIACMPWLRLMMRQDIDRREFQRTSVRLDGHPSSGRVTADVVLGGPSLTSLWDDATVQGTVWQWLADFQRSVILWLEVAHSSPTASSHTLSHEMIMHKGADDDSCNVLENKIQASSERDGEEGCRRLLRMAYMIAVYSSHRMLLRETSSNCPTSHSEDSDSDVQVDSTTLELHDFIRMLHRADLNASSVPLEQLRLELLEYFHQQTVPHRTGDSDALPPAWLRWAVQVFSEIDVELLVALLKRFSQRVDDLHSNEVHPTAPLENAAGCGDTIDGAATTTAPWKAAGSGRGGGSRNPWLTELLPYLCRRLNDHYAGVESAHHRYVVGRKGRQLPLGLHQKWWDALSGLVTEHLTVNHLCSSLSTHRSLLLEDADVARFLSTANNKQSPSVSRLFDEDQCLSRRHRHAIVFPSLQVAPAVVGRRAQQQQPRASHILKAWTRRKAQDELELRSSSKPPSALGGSLLFSDGRSSRPLAQDPLLETN